MPHTLNIHLNGQPRSLELASAPAPLTEVIAALELKSDRVAVELNGEIVRRCMAWCRVSDGDRLEIVHFVGGGSAGTPVKRRNWS